MAIFNSASYGPPTRVIGNNFYGNIYAIELPKNYPSASIAAVANYYGASELPEVNVKILAVTDDLPSAFTIQNHTFLCSPNPLVPDVISDDLILGNEQDNQLRVGNGDDTTEGKAGNDILTGGKGPDIFKFESVHGQDTIKDFNFLEDTIPC